MKTVNKSYTIRKHHVSGKEFLANSYKSIKTVNGKALSFAEKMEVGLSMVSMFETKNTDHKAFADYALNVRKLIGSFNKAQRQKFKADLLALISAETGEYINLERVEPQKLVRTFFDLNIPINEIEKYGK